MNRFKLAIPLIIFALLALSLWRGLSLDPSHLPSALIDKPFPAFSLSTLGEGDKTTVNDKDLLGEPFLLNVWATWCYVCRVEHPYLMELNKRGVKIVGLNYRDEKEAAKQWLDRYKNPYQLNIYDVDGRLGLDLGVYGAPETYVVDAKGIIRYKHVGELNEKVWRSHIAALMVSE